MIVAALATVSFATSFVPSASATCVYNHTLCYTVQYPCVSIYSPQCTNYDGQKCYVVQGGSGILCEE